MTREDYAKQTNWKGKATRTINVQDASLILDEDENVIGIDVYNRGENYIYKEGAIINPGMCWTDGGMFTEESNANSIEIIFKTKYEIEGHKVNYTNKQELKDIGAEDCEDENEILINRDFVIESFSFDLDEQTNEILMICVELIELSEI